MSEETITLRGGPRDGEVLTWRGGDTVEFPVFEPMMASYDPGVLNEPVPYKTALYRRSLRTSSVFVFQP